MPEKDPTTWSIGTWALGAVMAMAGGWASFSAKLKAGKVRPFNVVELAGEMVISGAVGLGCYMAAIALDSSLALAAVFSGVGGHMGTRLLFVVEKKLEAAAEAFELKK
jgi:hypothetical protein